MRVWATNFGSVISFSSESLIADIIDPYQALHNELKNTCRPTLSQQKFVHNFTNYYNDWFTYDVEYFLGMYRSKFLLDEFIALKNNAMVVY